MALLLPLGFIVILAASMAAGDFPRPPVVNLQPLIGILSQPGDGDDGLAPRLHRLKDSNENVSYIAASYVKWVEMAGARPVPLIYNEPKAELTRKFNMVNGLLLPGGAAPLVPGPYWDAVEHVLNLALEANHRGDFFPVEGTCLGMETFGIYFSQNFSLLQADYFDSIDVATALHFTSAKALTRGPFPWFPKATLELVQTQGLTLENHESGYTVEQFLSSKKLADFFDILTTSLDMAGKEYVSTIEGKHYPFYGTQWHPEKSCFEWRLNNTPHSEGAIDVCQQTGNFFINEARRNSHSAPLEEVDDILIYNHVPLFSGKNGYGFFEQVYVFDEQLPARRLKAK